MSDRRTRAMAKRKRRFDSKDNHMFKDITNELCREFRELLRDPALEIGTVIFKKLLKDKLDDFWADQPWYIRLFRKQIMSIVYRETFGKL